MCHCLPPSSETTFVKSLYILDNTAAAKQRFAQKTETIREITKPPNISFTKSHMRRGELVLHHHLHLPLSIAIHSTYTLDLITVGGIVRLFSINLKIFYTIFMIVDLIMG
jgi:hypothetical protein